MLGPLFKLSHVTASTIRWCSMHVVNLGVDLWLVGSCFKLLLEDFPAVFGEGNHAERLRFAWNTFKAWCSERRIPCLV